MSEVVSGMAEYSGVTITDNVGLVVSAAVTTTSFSSTVSILLFPCTQRMFEVDGEGATTVLEKVIIERNTGEMAYQIFRITDGAQGSLLSATIRMNNPVEVRPLANPGSIVPPSNCYVFSLVVVRSVCACRNRRYYTDGADPGLDL